MPQPQRSLSIAFVVTLVLCALVSCASASSNVVDLVKGNFDEVIDGSKPALVEFFAPWCGHCKTLAPIYEELGNAYAHAQSDVTIAKVDADSEKDLGKRFGISGFPTLKWFPKGTDAAPEDYKGGRDLDSLVKFVDEKAGVKARIVKPHSHVTVLTSGSFDDVINDPNTNVLLEVYAPWCGHCKNLAPIYEKVAKTFASESHVVIANLDATASPDIAERYGVTGYPTIKFFPAGGDPKAPLDYTGGRAEGDFIEYLNEKTGTQRAVGGGLTDLAGRIEALDALAKEFVTAAGDERVKLIAKAKDLIAKSTNKGAAYYGKVMAKISGGKEGFVATEIARLKRILDAGNTDLAKLESMLIRKNILSAFVGTHKESEGIERVEL
ncbi:hypothetical protein HDU89_007607 [Geranomyces variabilis]|nr:hypothetical protein HDU89_007607 [Geranomyces variabilis]